MLADYCLFYYKGELRLEPPWTLCWRGWCGDANGGRLRFSD